LPNIKAAVKSVRQSQKRTQRNLSVKTRLRTLHKKASAAPDTAFSRGVESQFDKAASKGIIHPNKAARKKSRLAKALNAAATTQAGAKPVKAPARRKAAPRKTTRKAASKKKG
jgi:small subunit ribosomal protein S20